MNVGPNVLLMMADDMGYSDLGCYGGELNTPNLDRLAAEGIRFTQFYNTARCAPTRASLLTGLHPHQTGIGILTYDDGPEGYEGNLNKSCMTMAEALKQSHYRTYLSGEWHLTKDTQNKNDTWPTERGFDRFYGILQGSCSFFNPHSLMRDNENVEFEADADDFYLTDAITANAVNFIEQHAQKYSGLPFFQYVAYTAPHFPLHARKQDIEKYKGKFDRGWDRLRAERAERMRRTGIIDKDWKMSERDDSVPSWEEEPHKQYRLRCMEVYAAQVGRMDDGIGKIIAALERTNQLDNTLILFLSDNGGSAEEIKPHPVPGCDLLPRPFTRNGEPVILGNHTDLLPGGANTYQTYGAAWANVSNTPFRRYKSWVHEGGIATPLIVRYPPLIADPGALRHTPGQLPDLMTTVLEITGTPYPKQLGGHPLPPLEGQSLTSVFRDDALPERCLFWEHEGNAAVRKGRWKLVKPYSRSWELYDMLRDRTELCDLTADHEQIVTELEQQYADWAARCRVIPREQILAIVGRVTRPNDYFGWSI